MIDPREVSETEIVLLVEAAVRRTHTAAEARDAIGVRFSPQPVVVVVWEKNRRTFGVLIQPFHGAADIHAVCTRS
jgi:hypothetical protein